MELPFIRAGIYAEPKCGKTRLATSLPWGERWGTKALYVAADMDSENLGSVLLHNREHLVTEKPTYDKSKGRTPHTEAFRIASTDWASKGYQTLIWDTGSTTAEELLHYYADSGVFQGDKGDKHISVGDAHSYMAQPLQGDYAVAQGAVARVLRMLFQQRMNVIVLFHQDSTEAEGLGTYGPKTVGRSTIRTVAGMFDNLLRIEVKDRAVQTRAGVAPQIVQDYIVHTARQGRFMAGVRIPHVDNPYPQIVMEKDPINVWRTFEALTQGEK